MVAEVLVEIEKIDKTFTYLIPSNLNVQIGIRVLVPFGKQKLEGFVVAIKNEIPSEYKLKEIISLVDEKPILNEELLRLGKYMQELTLCNLITAYQTMLPSALKVKEQKVDYNEYEVWLKLNCSKEDALEYTFTHRKSHKTEILEALLEKSMVLKKDYQIASVRELVKLGLVGEEKKVKESIVENTALNIDKTLNEDQLKVYDTIINSLD